MTSDNDTVYVPDYLSSDPENVIYIPTYLSLSSNESISTLASGCCTTECSEYCMSSQSGGGCYEYCGESCSQSCTQSCSQSCSESSGGCCTTECSEYSMSCFEYCGESCGESCGQTSTQKPGSATSLTITSIGFSEVTIKLGSITDADYYEVAYHVSGSSKTTYEYVYSTTYTVTGLEPDTTYVINYRGVNDAGVGNFLSSGKTFTTKAVTAYIEVVSVSYDSITVQLNGLATGYSYNDRKCQWIIDGVAKITIPFGGNVAYAATYTFTNLQPETTYKIQALVTGESGGGFSKTLSETVKTTSAGGVRINNGSTWNRYIPYIYTNSEWKRAIPYIHNGSSWVKTI